ncbi:unnamed protein product, partial [Didymodactylos carnosus]
ELYKSFCPDSTSKISNDTSLTSTTDEQSSTAIDNANNNNSDGWKISFEQFNTAMNDEKCLVNWFAIKFSLEDKIVNYNQDCLR